jgi:hypothetical protein
MFYTKVTNNNSSKTPLSRRDGAVSELSRSPLGDFGTSATKIPLSSHSANLRTSQVAFDWARNTNPFQRLKNLLTLEENWDRYGAPRFLRPQVVRAFELYSNIYSYYLSKEMNFSQFAPFIAPCSNGAILFEWAGRRFPERELEIFVPSSMESPLEFLKCEDNLEQEGTFEANQVNTLLDWLFATER